MVYISPEEGKIIRNAQYERALSEYVPKHTADEYMEFIERNSNGFDIHHNGGQAAGDNFPKFQSLFTGLSQWVQGNCLTECLDSAMRIEAIDQIESTKPLYSLEGRTLLSYLEGPRNDVRTVVKYKKYTAIVNTALNPEEVDIQIQWSVRIRLKRYFKCRKYKGRKGQWISENYITEEASHEDVPSDVIDKIYDLHLKNVRKK